ncbi:MAG: serine/threonine-protein kinase [Sandaracinus sp.]
MTDPEPHAPPHELGTRETLPGARELVCPACGRVSGLDVRFCATCGFRFRAAEADEEPGLMLRDVRDHADPLVGRTIAERYQILELIGRGGMGVVYRVEHTRIAKAMALKLLHGELARDKEVARRFRREAEAVSKLDHPNTVAIFDFGRAEGMTYLVMELLGGKDLGAILAQEGTISFTRMAQLAVQVCASVQQAHERGIVHRDLKPENLRVLARGDQREFVKVLDFGLAKLRDNEEHARASITREGFLVGTPYYMAPEHIRGEQVDARSDVYALGALMYKAVVGVPPFWANTPVAVLTKHLSDPVVPPTKRAQRRDLPAAADTILLKALEKRPEDRYQTMDELRDALADYLESVGISLDSGRTRPPSMPVSSPRVSTEHGKVEVATRGDVDRYERRLRLAAYAQGLALVLALAGVAAGGVYLWQHGAPRLDPLGGALTETEPNDAPEDASPLVLGQAVTAHLGARHDATTGDADVFALDATSGPGAVTIEATAPPNIDVELDLFRSGRADPVLHVDRAGVGGTEHVESFPLDGTHYLLRVREVPGHTVFPTENVSDTYTVRWLPHTPGEHEERELDDDVTHANEVALGTEWTGYLGWNGDRDVYCLDGPTEGSASVEASGAGLDLVLTVRELEHDREHVVNDAGEGAGEHWASEGALGAHTCAVVTEREGATRTSEDGRYTIRCHEPE